MKKLMFYGSLRKGQYNYDRFKSMFGDGFNYLSTTFIRGYKLYDLGSYPGLNKSDNQDDEVVVDIFECSDDCYKRIYNMEIGAGYSLIQAMDGQTGEMYDIYLYNYQEGDLVESGDWSKYLQQVEN